ncbi:hypothetical protein PUN28_006466 [Cardiocondyla obscurior]|uniref:Uncharacterized protein n=1 Tax=Cardiocondyla obscurior TaxID=286306 RepID=A0AAW2GDS4_9HYME
MKASYPVRSGEGIDRIKNVDCRLVEKKESPYAHMLTYLRSIKIINKRRRRRESIAEVRAHVFSHRPRPRAASRNPFAQRNYGIGVTTPRVRSLFSEKDVRVGARPRDIGLNNSPLNEFVTPDTGKSRSAPAAGDFTLRQRHRVHFISDRKSSPLFIARDLYADRI